MQRTSSTTKNSPQQPPSPKPITQTCSETTAETQTHKKGPRDHVKSPSETYWEGYMIYLSEVSVSSCCCLLDGYIFSCWVRDGVPALRSVGRSIYIFPIFSMNIQKFDNTILEHKLCEAKGRWKVCFGDGWMNGWMGRNGYGTERIVYHFYIYIGLEPCQTQWFDWWAVFWF